MSTRQWILLCATALAAVTFMGVLMLREDMPPASLPEVNESDAPDRIEQPPGAPPTRATPPQPSRPGRRQLQAGEPKLITGRVQREDGGAVTAAIIQLHADDQVATTTSGGDGRFSLPASLAATLSLVIDHPDFAGRQIRGVVAGQDYIVTLGGGVRVTGTIREKETDRPVAGALVLLQPAEGAARHALSDLRGEVTIDHVQPGAALLDCVAVGWQESVTHVEVPGRLTVELTRGQDLTCRVVDGGNHQPIPGARITCRVGQLIDKSWSVTPLATPEVVAMSDANGWFQMQGVALQSATVTVAASGYATRDVTRKMTGGSDIELHGFATLHGVVVDSRGRSVAGAQVFLRDDRSTRTTTGESGEFTFEQLDPYRQVVVAARHRELAPVATERLTLPFSESLRLTLRPGATITGVVRDESGHPKRDLVVFFEANSDALQEWPALFEDSATSAFDGTFTLTGLPADTYTVTADSQPSVTARVAVGEGKSASVDLTIPAAGSIEGICVDATGRPLASVSVFISKKSADRLASPDIIESGPDGRFTCHRYSADSTVEISAYRQGYADAQATVRTPVRDLILRLMPPRTLRGRVRVAVSGEPVTRFAVHLDPEDCDVAMGWHPNGEFVIAGLRLNAHDVSIAAPGCKNAMFPGRACGDEHAQEFLVRRAPLWGTITEQNGDPAKDVLVSLSGSTTASALTDDQGLFSFDNVNSGEIELRVCAIANSLVPAVPVEIVTLLPEQSVERHYVLPSR